MAWRVCEVWWSGGVCLFAVRLVEERVAGEGGRVSGTGREEKGGGLDGTGLGGRNVCGAERQGGEGSRGGRESMALGGGEDRHDEVDFDIAPAKVTHIAGPWSGPVGDWSD